MMTSTKDVTAPRELSTEELDLISGGFSWKGFAGAVTAGAATGALGGSVVGGVGAAPGGLAGGLLGGIGYCISSIF